MSPEFIFYIQLLLVISVDLLVGDPRWLPHPIRFIGRLCEASETLLRQSFPGIGLKIKGVAAFILVLSATLGMLFLVLLVLARISGFAALAGAFVVSYFCIAAGDLVAHSRRVHQLLVVGNLMEGRRAVAMMVGRDTAQLDSAGISRACVESVAENMVDGITAPLFWGIFASFVAWMLPVDPLICAAFGLTAYKAVNTMDSMYGYKNERYLEFGWFAARVDDICNFVPARLSGLCLMAAAYLLGYDGRASGKVFFKDRLRSSSPNSGHPEAAVAGALGIQLGGAASYFGKATYKPYIGEGLAQPGADEIVKTNRLALTGSLVFFLFCCLTHLLLVNLCI